MGLPFASSLLTFSLCLTVIFIDFSLKSGKGTPFCFDYFFDRSIINRVTLVPEYIIPQILLKKAKKTHGDTIVTIINVNVTLQENYAQ